MSNAASTTSFESSVSPNVIVIMESLSNNERKTGLDLAHDIKITCEQFNMGLYYHRISSRESFFAAMKSLAERAKSDGWKPILHLELHGDTVRGLEIRPSSEFISWAEFTTLCREISVATHNDFIVVMAVCHGFHAVVDPNHKTSQVGVGKPTPFTILIGALDKITEKEIIEAFVPFYRTLLSSQEFAKARAHLTANFFMYDSEKLFIQSFARYVREQTTGKTSRERTEGLLSQARALNPRLNVTNTRRSAKAHVRNWRSAFRRHRDLFLLADHEYNRDRFLVTADDIDAALAGS